MKTPDNHEVVPTAHHSRHVRSGKSLRDRVVIGSTVIGVGLFVVFGIPYLKQNLSTGIESLNAIANPRKTIVDPSKEPSNGADDRDRHAVRDYLRANLDDPHPREIQWWPARELVELHRQRLESARAASTDEPELDEYIDQLERDGPDRVCRLRYAVRNSSGTEVPADDLFVIRNGRARRLRKGSATERSARAYFH
jgi:hypothetical protein